MTADLEAVIVTPKVIGVVDHPRREPERLALDGCDVGQTGIARPAAHGFTRSEFRQLGHRLSPVAASISRTGRQRLSNCIAKGGRNGIIYCEADFRE